MTPAGTSNPKVAVIDTDESFRSGISADLGDEFEIFEGDDFEDAYHHIQESGLDVLLLQAVDFQSPVGGAAVLAGPGDRVGVEGAE